MKVTISDRAFRRLCLAVAVVFVGLVVSCILFCGSGE